MQCKRLEKQIKAWYVQVQGEAMAPARMVEFMEQHILDCELCLTDEAVRLDVNRITEIILPPAKVRKKTVAKTNDEQPAGAVKESKDVAAADSHDEVVAPDPEDPVSEDEYGDNEVELPVPDVDG